MKKVHELKSPQVKPFIRHSLRDGFTAYSTLFPAIGLFVTVVGAMREHRRQLDVSVETSEPHGFVVRFVCTRLLHQKRPSHPALYVRDDRDTPLLVEAGRERICR